MREIKFRAWDTENKEMVINFAHIGANGRFYTIHHTGKEPDYIPMQYTGLKDKNGAEIYEDDIIQWEDGSKYQVNYRIGCFWACNELYDEYDKVEKIGNIYEDKELLK